MAAPDFALAFYAAQLDLALAAAQVAGDMWADVNPADIAGSWAALLPEMQAVTSGAQLAAATLAGPYLEEAAAFADAVEDVADKLVPKAFAGIASDGRQLASLLYQPVITSLLTIKHGADTRTGLAAGRATAQMITRTQVADAGRSAVQVGMTPRKKLEGQIRIAVGKSCSRCVILAGKWYAYNAGFDRHLNCDCVGVPARGAARAGIDQDPQVIYDSLTPRERSQAGWSYADQKAIADGADLNQVTNFRRKGSLFVADGRQYTREGAKTRGRRGIKAARKTPGQIYREAGNDRDKAIALLRENGYLFGTAKTKAVAAVAEPDRQPVRILAARARKAAEGDAALKAAPLSITDLQGDAFSLARQYKSQAYININGQLRRLGDKPIPRGFAYGFLRDVTKALDPAMDRSKLTSDVLAYKGIASGEQVFGKAWHKSLVNAEWTEHGYDSTSPLRKVAEGFVEADGALLILRVPKGTGAIQLSGTDYEAELLLQRKLRRRVISDTGPGPNRVIEVEVTPAETVTHQLDKKTVAQLRDLAKQRGVKIPSGARKADIVQLLEGAPPAGAGDLTKLTVAQLRAMAKDRGVKVLTKDRKADLIAKLEQGKVQPDVKAAAEHLNKLVGQLPERIQPAVSEAMKLQSPLVPKTALRLAEIAAPTSGDLAREFYRTQGIFAYYMPGTRQLVLNPGWAKDDIRGLGIEDAKSLAGAVRRCNEAGWFTHSGGLDELGGMCSHEFGHHVSAAFVRLDPATGDQSLPSAAANRLFPMLDRALGTKSGALGRSGDVSGKALDAWVERNRKTLEKAVSQYGAEDFHEMLAEIWREYSTMGSRARPGIREVGELMREMAEAAS